MQHEDGELMADYLLSLGIGLIFYISLSALYTVEAKHNIFVLPLHSCCAAPVPDRHVPKIKSHPFTGSRLLPAWSQ